MICQETRSGRRCPECRGRLPRSSDAMAALVDHGCVYCGASLDGDASEPVR